MRSIVLTIGLAVCALLASSVGSTERYDVVIHHGRVMDPESNLDAIRDVGIRDGRIAAISEAPLDGRDVIEASGLVAAPGFIDLHWHGTDPRSSYYEAMDGVTSTFELEIGVADVDAWYDARRGRMPINYGASIGHAPVRMRVMGDPGAFVPAGDAARKPASETELAAIKAGVEHGLQRGAVGVGFGLAYTAAATRREILDVFRLAARYGATGFVHIRGASSAGSADREEGLLEVIAHSAVSGAPVHVAHINSSGQEAVTRLLDIIEAARAHGVDVSTEAYPYTAGMTRLESYLFDSWTDKPESEYAKLQWVATGERLTRESFAKYRKQGGYVLIHANTEERVRTAVTHPLTLIASDGFDIDPPSHPRSAGTFSRMLGRYVREERAVDLMQALRKMTLMPARRLEVRVPAMANKGRIRVGADADIVVFDPARIRDTATYEQPARYAEGMHSVLVNGQFVVRDGRLLDQATPGQPVRAPIRSD
ncbi:MAG TPA: amidohydrolase family protein [Burkholderiales bacterium]|nr:amidohydrolase family protein [Burkholderiales bacterium]